MIPLRFLSPALVLGAQEPDAWDSLFGREIPFKAEAQILLYALPGILLAILLGIALNVMLEWVISKIHRGASKSNYWALVGLAFTIYVTGFTPFNAEVARITRWYKIVKPPRTAPKTAAPRQAWLPPDPETGSPRRMECESV